MAKTTYRLNDIHKTKPVLRYRYGQDGIDYSSKLVEPSNDGSDFLATEQDVISEWAHFAKLAFIGEFRESDSKCWVGHYEQFGMVMLNLAKMARYRKGFQGHWNDWYDGVMDDEMYHYILTGPTGTEDRILYRCWFRLLGHPDFLDETLNKSEVYSYKLAELCLYIAFDDMNRRLLYKKK